MRNFGQAALFAGWVPVGWNGAKRLPAEENAHRHRRVPIQQEEFPRSLEGAVDIENRIVRNWREAGDCGGNDKNLSQMGWLET